MAVLKKLKDWYSYKITSKNKPKYIESDRKGEVFCQVIYTNHYDTFYDQEDDLSNIIISFIISINEDTRDVTLGDLSEFLSINPEIKTIQKYNTSTQTLCILVSGSVQDFSSLLLNAYKVHKLENNIFVNELRYTIVFLSPKGFDNSVLNQIGMDQELFSYENNFTINKSKIADYKTSVQRLKESNNPSGFVIIEMDHLESLVTNDDIGLSEFFTLQDIMELSYTIISISSLQINSEVKKSKRINIPIFNLNFPLVIKIRTKELVELIDSSDEDYCELLSSIKDHISNIYYNFNGYNCYNDKEKIFHLFIEEEKIKIDPYASIDEIL